MHGLPKVQRLIKSSSGRCCRSPITSSMTGLCIRKMWSFTTVTTPISLLLPTRVRRHSPTPRMPSRWNAISGLAMRLRAVVRLVMTIRRWALPQRVAGYRCNAILPKWASMSKRNLSPLQVLATCRATFSAMACCFQRRSKLSRRSTIVISSLIPIPTRRPVGKNVNVCSICRVPAGSIMTQS